jgi:hypothetical protein
MDHSDWRPAAVFSAWRILFPRIQKGSDMAPTYTRVAIVVAIVASLPGCAKRVQKLDTQEAVAREMNACLSQTAELLESIDDRVSAEQAKPKLDALYERFESLKKRSEQLPNLSADERIKLSMKLQPQSDRVMRRLFQAHKRLESIPGAAEAAFGRNPPAKPK